MIYNIMVECPDCVSLADANGFFSHLICAIQDLELEIADMQHAIARLSHPNEAEQLQLYGKFSYLPELIQDPVLCKFLAFKDISIEEWQESIDQHLQDLQDCANGDDVVATDIL